MKFEACDPFLTFAILRFARAILLFHFLNNECMKSFEDMAVWHVPTKLLSCSILFLCNALYLLVHECQFMRFQATKSELGTLYLLLANRTLPKKRPLLKNTILSFKLHWVGFFLLEVHSFGCWRHILTVLWYKRRLLNDHLCFYHLRKVRLMKLV